MKEWLFVYSILDTINLYYNYNLFQVLKLKKSHIATICRSIERCQHKTAIPTHICPLKYDSPYEQELHIRGSCNPLTVTLYLLAMKYLTNGWMYMM